MVGTVVPRTRTAPTLEDVVEAANTWVFRLATVVLFVMILSIGYEVVMRYLFVKPTLWVTEYSGYALVIATFLAAAQTQRLGRHVTVDIVLVRFPLRVQRALGIISTLFALGFVAVLGWQGWAMASKSLELNRISSTLMETPVFYPQVTIPIGCFLLFLQLLIQLYHDVRPDPRALPTATREGES